MQLWIVGQFRAETPNGSVWDFQGVFDSRDKAVAACKSRNYFVAPVDTNSEVPDERRDWPGCEYPAQ